MTRAPLAVAVLMAVLGAGCTSTRAPSFEERDPVGGEIPPPPKKKGWSKEQKAIALNAAAAAAVLAYGSSFWNYGEEKNFQFVDEGWFSKDTKFGGADKIGHMYTSYVATLAFAAAYEGIGYEREDADKYGAISAWAMWFLIEVGDGFSKHGFSPQDLVMDTAGVAFGYVRRRVPTLARFLDFRIEYFPSEAVTELGKSDLSTDYSGYKYVFAFKLSGFEKLHRTPLEFVELQVGYYTRGFLIEDDQFYDGRSRNLYFAVGLNLSQILGRLGVGNIRKFFNYYQVPNTYVPLATLTD